MNYKILEVRATRCRTRGRIPVFGAGVDLAVVDVDGGKIEQALSQAGAVTSLGSNNSKPGDPHKVVHGQQWITEHQLNASAVTIYSKHELDA